MARYLGKIKLLSITFYFNFLYNFVWKISHSKKNSDRYYHRFLSAVCCCVVMYAVRISLYDMLWRHRQVVDVCSLLIHVTMTLEEGEWWTSHPVCLSCGKKTWYALHRKLDWPHGWSGWVANISSTRVWTIQLLAICYTDCAVMCHHINIIN